MTHDATTSFNNEIKSLSGDYVIDALINGHLIMNMLTMNQEVVMLTYQLSIWS